MNFAEASELARSIPGAVLTRGEDGAFVVLVNGRQVDRNKANRQLESVQIDSAGQGSTRDRVVELEAELRNQFEAHRSNVQSLTQLHEQQISEARQALATKQNELNRANHLCDVFRRQVVDLGAQLDELQNENAALRSKLETLQRKIDLVPAEEWQRLTESLAAASAAASEEKRRTRRLVNCSCLGEVEGCFKCGGTGSYTVDGYGNVV
jgi:chromosome segregation ATPase